jgi:hypothetical protein
LYFFGRTEWGTNAAQQQQQQQESQHTLAATTCRQTATAYYPKGRQKMAWPNPFSPDIPTTEGRRY